MLKSDMPDLLVSINTSAKEKVYVNTNYGAWGWGWNPWMWGPNQNTVSSRTEGVLYIDLIDAKTKQLVWQGKGKGGISEYSKNRDARIGIFVAEILKNFPPDSALSDGIKSLAALKAWGIPAGFFPPAVAKKGCPPPPP